MPRPKLRLTSSRRSKSGVLRLSWITVKTIRDTAAIRARRTIKVEPNQSSFSPSSSTVSSEPRPMAMVMTPAQSPWRSKLSCIGSRSSENQSMANITAPGSRLTKKIDCQPKVSLHQPPIAGPMDGAKIAEIA